MNDNPSGIEMLQRGNRVKDRVADILRTYPQSKGDDMLLIWHYYKEYTNIRISFKQFRDLLNAPSPETIRRRRQEIQHPERVLVEQGKLRLEDCVYLPKQRTVKKRKRNEEVHKDYYSGRMRLTDWESE